MFDWDLNVHLLTTKNSKHLSFFLFEFHSENVFCDKIFKFAETTLDLCYPLPWFSSAKYCYVIYY